VATVLVQRGTLRTGDIVVAGAEWGRVRALVNDQGADVKERAPRSRSRCSASTARPEAGDRVAVVENEARAREVTDTARARSGIVRPPRGAGGRSLADMMRDLKEGAGRKEFPAVVRADVQGSAEAIMGALDKLGTDEVSARILQAGVGGISESDITLAEASGAVVLGFNVRAHKEAREAAERAGVEIRYYNIIYDLVDDVKAAMSGLLAPTLREERLGEAQILEIFDVSKVGKIAGCRVLDGVVPARRECPPDPRQRRGARGQAVAAQALQGRRREVTAGQECGMSFENYQDMRAGDVIECYNVTR
jgi:translation initiation factor IF-2